MTETSPKAAGMSPAGRHDHDRIPNIGGKRKTITTG